MEHRYPRAFRAASGSLVANLLRRATPHPHTFVCGVRWPDDAAPSGRWHYERAWVDPWAEGHDGKQLRVRLGDKQILHIRLDPNPWWSGDGPPPRPGMLTLAARSTQAGERVLLAVPAGNVCDFGVDAL